MYVGYRMITGPTMNIVSKCVEFAEAIARRMAPLVLLGMGK
jgi:hypothetical protein